MKESVELTEQLENWRSKLNVLRAVYRKSMRKQMEVRKTTSSSQTDPKLK
ncbi:MAG: hypothetical protein ACLROH_04925 [Streptococcus sp.]